MQFVYKLKLESPTEGNTLIVFKYLNYSHLIEFLNYCRYNIYFDITKKAVILDYTIYYSYYDGKV